MAVKVLKDDIIPNYLICEDSNNNKIIMHKNIIENNYFNELKADKRLINLKGKHINKWDILFYVGNRKWVCRCECGRYCAITGYNLMYNKSISCGHERVQDLTGQQIGEWTVIEYAGTEHGMSQWLCECSCHNKKIVYGKNLLSGQSKSCGHNTSAFKDLTGQQFGEWTVKRYLGNRMWECECSCHNMGVIESSSLIRGYSKSCGHLTKELWKNTMLTKYGEIALKKEVQREQWQIDVISSKDKMEEFIKNNFSIPTNAKELSNKLNINTNNVYRKIHEYSLEKLINIDYNSSQYEDEIYNILKNVEDNIIRRFKLQSGKEIDIYIPNKRIGIEFNGNYFHSEIHKNKNYHLDKSKECMNENIRLIHIFEYEWNDMDTRNKLINIIRSALGINDIIGARNTYVTEIDKQTSSEFLNKYHLQCDANSSIKIGCFSNKTNILLGVITLGKPRFNNKYQYEIIRICWKHNTIVNGGIEKMFSYILKQYNIQSIISYVDFSKFTGKSYEKIHMINSGITEPSYVWYNANTKNILSRYQTQKQLLINKELGTDDETESDIMHRLDYVKIYNCGNIVMTYEE